MIIIEILNLRAEKGRNFEIKGKSMNVIFSVYAYKY
ncbi:Uncharacterised protein [Staphylococcus capitis]|nr:Uncharacterised protein [Staphylococcus capitis]